MMQPQIQTALLSLLLCTVPCFAQDTGSLFDTPFPSTYIAAGAESVPAVVTSQFYFTTITGRADQQQSLASYPQGFPAIACGNTSESFNISFAELYTPEGSRDYAVHLSIRNPYPNNVTGSNIAADQPIFSIVWDTWLNLRTGVVSGLNYTQVDDQAAVFTFDSQYDGQVVQGTNQADPTHFFPQTVYYISTDAFYGASNNSNGNTAVSFYLYPPPALNSVTPTGSGNARNWIQNVESLQLYGGFIAMQATRSSSCTANTMGFYELAPLLDYITDTLQDVVRDNASTFSNQQLGQLNTTYVQSNSNVSPEIYASLRTTGAYLPVEQLIRDPFLSLTESQCIVQAKNYTLTVATVNGSPPANVWNFCATGICNYTFANGTTGQSISHYAGLHTASTCQLGYSSAVDRNEYVEPAYIQSPGQGSAGRFNPARAGIVAAPGTIQTSSSSFEGSTAPTYLEDGSAAYDEGASNAPSDAPPTSTGGHGFCNGHC